VGELVAILAAKFFTDLRTADPRKLKVFSDLVAGVLISETVLTLQQPSNVEELGGVKACLDAPLVLDLLDLNTPEQTEYAAQLMQSISSAGLQPCVYSHSVREMLEVIKGPISAMRSGKRPYGLLGARLVQDQGHLAYARTVLSSLDSILTERGIEIIDSDEIADDESYQGSNLEDRLFPYVGAMHADVRPRHRDVKSASYSWYLRSHDNPQSLVDTSVIFISRNHRLVRGIQRFFRRDEEFSEGVFPPVITDSELACLLWFATGGTENNLTQMKLVANCAAAIEPSKSVVSSMRQVLFETDQSKLTQFEALMGDRRARACLTVEALGERQIFSVDRAHQILEEMRQSLTAEKEREMAERVLREKRKHSKEASKIWGDLNRERERASEEGLKRSRVEAENAQLQTAEKERKERAEESITMAFERKVKSYRVAYICLHVILVSALTAGSYHLVDNALYTIPVGVVLALFGSLYIPLSARRVIERQAKGQVIQRASEFGYPRSEVEGFLKDVAFKW
jgi:hypothetical protein